QGCSGSIVRNSSHGGIESDIAVEVFSHGFVNALHAVGQLVFQCDVIKQVQFHIAQCGAVFCHQLRASIGITNVDCSPVGTDQIDLFVTELTAFLDNINHGFLVVGKELLA